MYYGKKKKNLSLAEEQGKFSSVSDDQQGLGPSPLNRLNE